MPRPPEVKRGEMPCRGPRVFHSALLRTSAVASCYRYDLFIDTILATGNQSSNIIPRSNLACLFHTCREQALVGFSIVRFRMRLQHPFVWGRMAAPKGGQDGGGSRQTTWPSHRGVSACCPVSTPNLERYRETLINCGGMNARRSVHKDTN